MPALTVHNAEIKTAAVEIRTLTISGKQVTLAVFRQLREEALVARDGTLNGVPWGTVNYHPVPKQCDDRPDHWHVVWQRGSELLRSTVTKSVRWRTEEFWPESGSDLLAAHVRDVILGAGSRFWSGEIPDFDNDSHFSFLERGSLPVVVDLSDATRAAVVQSRRCGDLEHELLRRPSTSTWWHEARKSVGVEAARRASYHLVDLAVSELGDTSLDELGEEYRGEIDAELARRGRHDSVRAAIADLPQLFIAV